MNDNEQQDNLLDDELLFESDSADDTDADDNDLKPWLILIADDDDEVHNITKLVLSDYVFDGRGLEFISAYSGEETKKILQEHPDTAMILLDVVMETDDCGLRVARYIRKELKNNFVQIVLRTGQPGKAPENKVIMEYEINDYKEKTELTAKKLFTTVTSSLRAYRDLRIIEKTQQVLELVIRSSDHQFQYESLQELTTGILSQILTKLKLDENSLYLQTLGFAGIKNKNKLFVLAATGEYYQYINRLAMDVLPTEVRLNIQKALDNKESLFIDDVYIGYFCSENGSENLLYLNGYTKLTDLERNLLSVFSTNVAIAFDNIYLTREIVDTQKEVIFALGEVIDTISKGTGNHVRRVAEISRLLALKAGIDAKSAEILRLASPMHDVGKIGIPESILNKPGGLTAEEFDTIKTHSGIGYDILKNSQREIMQAATIVAEQHHERWDGKGYPKGLRGEEIHIYGRITGIADVFDALSHDRAYKKAWSIEKIVESMTTEKGKHFDPQLVDIFLENINDFVSINERFPEGKTREAE